MIVVHVYAPDLRGMEATLLAVVEKEKFKRFDKTWTKGGVYSLDGAIKAPTEYLLSSTGGWTMLATDVLTKWSEKE